MLVVDGDYYVACDGDVVEAALRKGIAARRTALLDGVKTVTVLPYLDGLVGMDDVPREQESAVQLLS